MAETQENILYYCRKCMERSIMFKNKGFGSDPQTRRSLPARLARWLGIASVCLTAALLLSIVLLRWLPAPTSAFMLRHHLDGRKAVYRWVSWSDINPAVPIAVVASEDQRFPDHWGFDFNAIAHAVDINHKRSSPRGASTISQQVAKNLFLWPGKSWLRKGLEAVLTLAIEIFWPKRRILEVYLNIAQFGPDTFGVGAASRRYFGVSPSRLDPHQAALLAAVLPGPDYYRLSPPSPYMQQRAAEIRHQVKLLGGSAYLTGLK